MRRHSDLHPRGGANTPVVVLLLLLSLLCSLSFTEAQTDYTDIRIFKLGDSVTLNCTSDSEQYKDNPFNGSAPVSWMLPAPGLAIVSESEPKYILGADNWTLTIMNTSTSDLGQYHCMFYNQSAQNPWYLVKVGLNVRGPYFDVLWDKYELPTIIGICALFGFLLLALVVVLLYHFRYIPEETAGPDQTGLMSAAVTEISAVGYKPTLEKYEGYVSEPVYENKGYEKGSEEVGGGSSGVSSTEDKEDAPCYAEVTRSHEPEGHTLAVMTSAGDSDSAQGDHDSEPTTAL